MTASGFQLVFTPLPPLPHEVGEVGEVEERPPQSSPPQLAAPPAERVDRRHAGLLSECGGVRAWLAANSWSKKRASRSPCSSEGKRRNLSDSAGRRLFHKIY